MQREAVTARSQDCVSRRTKPEFAAGFPETVSTVPDPPLVALLQKVHAIDVTCRLSEQLGGRDIEQCDLEAAGWVTRCSKQIQSLPHRAR